MRLKRQNNTGFTLIEAVVSTALFAMVITAIIGTYLSVLRLNTRTRAQRALSQNARFITEYLSKEIRNGHIDYTQYPNETIPDSSLDLYIVNQNNELEHIYLSDSLDNCANTACNLMLSKPGISPIPTALNSTSVKVTNLSFLTSPSQDPYIYSNGTNIQPHMTLLLELTANQAPRDALKMDLESTFSELYYPGRK